MEKLEEQLRIKREEIEKVNANMSVEIDRLKNAHSKRLMDIEQIRLGKERDISSMGKIKRFFLTQKLNIEIFFKKVGSSLKSIKERIEARKLENIYDNYIISLMNERDRLIKEINKLKKNTNNKNIEENKQLKEEENKEQEEEYSDSFSYPTSIDESEKIRNTGSSSEEDMTIDRSDITPPSSNNDLQEGNNLDCDSDSGYSVEISLSESIDLDYNDITSSSSNNNLQEGNNLDYNSGSGYSVNIPLLEPIDLDCSDITSSNLKKEENKEQEEENKEQEEYSDSFSYPMSIDESGEIRNTGSPSEEYMTTGCSNIILSSSNNNLQKENNLDCDSDYSSDILLSELIDLDNIEEKNSEPLSESIDLDHSDITSSSSNNNNLQEENNLDYNSDYLLDIPSYELTDLDYNDITLSNLKKEENKQLKEEENSLEESSKELTEIFVKNNNIIFR